MARPKKEGLDYFPVDVVFDEKIESIELIHHNDGLVWVLRFWQKAYKAMTGLVDFNGLFAELFSNKCRITIEKHQEILKTAIAVDFCHEVETGIYTSNGIQKRISSVSKDRSDAILRQNEKKKKSKVKKSKVKDCPGYSVNNKNMTHPTFEEFEKYCIDHRHKSIARQAYDGYAVADWHDSRGKKIKNWKQKVIHVWFRQDNEDGKQKETQMEMMERLQREGKI